MKTEAETNVSFLLVVKIVVQSKILSAHDYVDIVWTMKLEKLDLTALNWMSYIRIKLTPPVSLEHFKVKFVSAIKLTCIMCLTVYRL